MCIRDSLKQPEPEAQEIAIAIELFTNGSLNTFAKKTNVDTDNRLICYDILDLGKMCIRDRPFSLSEVSDPCLISSTTFSSIRMWQ